MFFLRAPFQNWLFSKVYMGGHNIPCSAWLFIPLSFFHFTYHLPKLFFFFFLAFELFFHPQFVSLHCRHVSDIKTYMTITRQ